MGRINIYERTVRGKRQRRCNRCEFWWPLDSFEKNTKCQGGRTGECRVCRAERRLRYA